MSLTIRPLREDDLGEARHILSRAFGTFIGLPDPDALRRRSGLRAHAVQRRSQRRFRRRGRRQADRVGVRHAVGQRRASSGRSRSTFPTGTAAWRSSCSSRSWAASSAGARGSTGLFTFAQSPKHVGLYSKYGFWPRSLTAILGKPVGRGGAARRRSERRRAMVAVRALLGGERRTEDRRCSTRRAASPDSVYPGLDLEQDIRAADEQRARRHRARARRQRRARRLRRLPRRRRDRGRRRDRLRQVRRGAAGAGRAAALRPAARRGRALRGRRGVAQVQAGMNMARDRAFRALRERGYRVGFQGVAMHRPNDPGYSESGDLRHRRLALAVRRSARATLVGRSSRSRRGSALPSRRGGHARSLASAAARCDAQAPADLVLRGGKVVTLDDARPQAQAIAIRRRRDRRGRLRRRDRALDRARDARRRARRAGSSFPASSKATATSWASATR